MLPDLGMRRLVHNLPAHMELGILRIKVEVLDANFEG